MVCNSCGKIIWFWEPKLWRLHSHLEWHDNEKCNPDNIHTMKHFIPSGEMLEDLNNSVYKTIEQIKLDKKIKKQQEDWE